MLLESLKVQEDLQNVNSVYEKWKERGKNIYR